MKITLICEHATGQVAFAAERIEGIYAPERRYNIHNHQIIIDGGFADVIVHHDVAELLRNSIYRMPTPVEQEAMARSEQEKHQVQEKETIPIADEETEQENEEALQADSASIEGEVALSTEPPAEPKQKRTYTRKAK